MDENKDTLPGAEKLKIGQKIKELRQKKHLTLQDLATKTQIDKAALSSIEGDEAVPPLGTLFETRPCPRCQYGLFLRGRGAD